MLYSQRRSGSLRAVFALLALAYKGCHAYLDVINPPLAPSFNNMSTPALKHNKSFKMLNVSMVILEGLDGCDDSYDWAQHKGRVVLVEQGFCIGRFVAERLQKAGISAVIIASDYFEVAGWSMLPRTKLTDDPRDPRRINPTGLTIPTVELGAKDYEHLKLAVRGLKGPFQVNLAPNHNPWTLYFGREEPCVDGPTWGKDHACPSSSHCQAITIIAMVLSGVVFLTCLRTWIHHQPLRMFPLRIVPKIALLGFALVHLWNVLQLALNPCNTGQYLAIMDDTILDMLKRPLLLALEMITVAYWDCAMHPPGSFSTPRVVQGPTVTYLISVWLLLTGLDLVAVVTSNPMMYGVSASSYLSHCVTTLYSVWYAFMATFTFAEASKGMAAFSELKFSLPGKQEMPQYAISVNNMSGSMRLASLFFLIECIFPFNGIFMARRSMYWYMITFTIKHYSRALLSLLCVAVLAQNGPRVRTKGAQRARLNRGSLAFKEDDEGGAKSHELQDRSANHESWRQPGEIGSSYKLPASDCNGELYVRNLCDIWESTEENEEHQCSIFVTKYRIYLSLTEGARPGARGFRGRNRRPGGVVPAHVQRVFDLPHLIISRVQFDEGMASCQIFTKDGRAVQLEFPTMEYMGIFRVEVENVFDHLTPQEEEPGLEMDSRLKADETHGFVFDYRPAGVDRMKCQVFEKEMIDDYTRMGIKAASDQSGGLEVKWKQFPSVNDKYMSCPTYPPMVYLPKSMSSQDVKTLWEMHARGRGPALSWMHPESNVGIIRCAQPLGSKYMDEFKSFFESVSNASSNGKEGKSVLVLDARPFANALANNYKGGCSSKGGYFSQDKYDSSCVEIQFCDIANIHVMRNSLSGVMDACASHSQHNPASALDKTGWLGHCRRVMCAASKVAHSISQEERSVIVHCSDGWDRTAQLTSLAMIMLDPYYRTFKGLATLVNKEWGYFGFQFGKRQGNEKPKSAHFDSNFSPVFLQWVDCVHQLCHQYPHAMEFTPAFLVHVMDCANDARYANFIENCHDNRMKVIQAKKAMSLWKHVEVHKEEHWKNAVYDPEICKDCIFPSCSLDKLVLWEDMYLRWNTSANMHKLNRSTGGAAAAGRKNENGGDFSSDDEEGGGMSETNAMFSGGGGGRQEQSPQFGSAQLGGFNAQRSPLENSFIRPGEGKSASPAGMASFNVTPGGAAGGSAAASPGFTSASELPSAPGNPPPGLASAGSSPFTAAPGVSPSRAPPAVAASEDWKAVLDGNGKVYYWNQKTGETAWEKPAQQSALRKLQAAAAFRGGLK